MPAPLGVDLGATNIRVGLVADRELTDVQEVPLGMTFDRILG